MFPAHTAHGERNQVERDAPRVRFRTRERKRHRRASHGTRQRRQRRSRCASQQRARHAPRGTSSFLRSSLNFAIFVLLLHSLVRVPFSACLLRDFFMGAQRTRLHLRQLCNDARRLPVR